MRRPLRIALLAVLSAVLCAPVVAIAPVATGQDRGPRREVTVEDDDGESAEDIDDQDVDSDVRTEGGEKVKVFRFSGLDLAGRLKSPQLLYFLNRMRAEFDRPRLPHRSFIPELQRSAQGKAFR